MISLNWDKCTRELKCIFDWIATSPTPFAVEEDRQIREKTMEQVTTKFSKNRVIPLNKLFVVYARVVYIFTALERESTWTSS